MRFRVIFTEDSVEQFSNLPKSVQILLKSAIKERLEADPLSYGKPLKYSWRGHRSLRVSDYRIIYRVDKQQIIVLIIKIDIRRDVYEG